MLGAFLLVNNPIVLSEEEIKDVQKAIKHLQQKNQKLNGVIQAYDILLKANVEENKQLKDDWNKLREWIVYNKHNENTEQHYLVVDYGTLLGKMQELEGSDSNV